MLLNLREYHRPGEGAPAGRQRERLDRVLSLLASRETHTAILAGGNTLLGSQDPAVEAVVDLQGLGLEGVTAEADRLWIGAMTTRANLTEGKLGAGSVAKVIVDGAARWSGSVQRNRATVGGALAVAAPNDPLVVALLACDACVALLSSAGVHELALADFLARRREVLSAPSLITDVSVSHSPADPQPGVGLAIVARTPADSPIVVACALLSISNGLCTHARLALGGVADMPVRMVEAEALLTGRPLDETLIASVAAEAGARVQPAGDFRGTAEYRQAMARVLSERALREAWECN